MPYIKQTRRTILEQGGKLPSTTGDLNYTLTRFIDRWLQKQPIGYATLNSVLGALERVKLELIVTMYQPDARPAFAIGKMVTDLYSQLGDIVSAFIMKDDGRDNPDVLFDDVLGVITAVQMELYRRLAAPYEDEKKNQNGDVFSANTLAEYT